MIWALLAILGVPIWLIVGFLIGIVMSRRKLTKQPDVFAIAVRAQGAEKWPRRPTYGRIVRDVLVLHRGAALLRTEVLAIDDVSELEIGEGPKRPTEAVGRLIRFADGSCREVAVAAAVADRILADRQAGASKG